MADEIPPGTPRDPRTGYYILPTPKAPKPPAVPQKGYSKRSAWAKGERRARRKVERASARADALKPAATPPTTGGGKKFTNAPTR